MTRNGITASNSTSQRQHISFCFLQNTPFHKQNDVIAVAEMWNYLLLTHFSVLYPLKIPEDQRFSGIFRWYKMGTIARSELITSAHYCSLNIYLPNAW